MIEFLMSTTGVLVVKILCCIMALIGFCFARKRIFRSFNYFYGKKIIPIVIIIIKLCFYFLPFVLCFILYKDYFFVFLFIGLLYWCYGNFGIEEICNYILKSKKIEKNENKNTEIITSNNNDIINSFYEGLFIENLTFDIKINDEKTIVRGVNYQSTRIYKINSIIYGIDLCNSKINFNEFPKIKVYLSYKYYIPVENSDFFTIKDSSYQKNKRFSKRGKGADSDVSNCTQDEILKLNDKLDNKFKDQLYNNLHVDDKKKKIQEEVKIRMLYKDDIKNKLFTYNTHEKIDLEFVYDDSEKKFQDKDSFSFYDLFVLNNNFEGSYEKKIESCINNYNIKIKENNRKLIDTDTKDKPNFLKIFFKKNKDSKELIVKE